MGYNTHTTHNFEVITSSKGTFLLIKRIKKQHLDLIHEGFQTEKHLPVPKWALEIFIS